MVKKPLEIFSILVIAGFQPWVFLSQKNFMAGRCYFCWTLAKLKWVLWAFVDLGLKKKHIFGIPHVNGEISWIPSPRRWSNQPFKVIFVDGAAHGQLFPRCSVIVHHGGAGTTYASAMSGVPCVILPVFLDQYLHSNLVNKKGIGTKTMLMKQWELSKKRLTNGEFTVCIHVIEILRECGNWAHPNKIRAESMNIYCVSFYMCSVYIFP